jgi:hypothetical protein
MVQSMRSLSVSALFLLSAAALGLAVPAHADGISKVVCVMDSSGRSKECFLVKTANINAMRSAYACDEPNGLRCESVW